MVKNSFLYLFSIVLLSSCQKEELITYAIEQKEPVQVIEPPEPVEPETENSKTDPSINWINNQQVATGLLTSSEHIDFVSLYDNVLAVILYVQIDERNKAERTLDFFNSRIQSEFDIGSGGFYQFRNASGENGSRRWLGDNAWLLIAVNHYKATFSDDKYNLLAAKLEAWIRDQQEEDGSLLGGFNEDGSAIPKVTEGIITAYNAVPGYDAFHKNILTYLKNNRWSDSDKNFMAWPENETYAHALDVFALSQGIFEDFPTSSLYAADDLFFTSQTATVSGEEIAGFCFDADKDVIWLEGSAQMAVAYKTIADTVRAQEVLIEIEKSFITSFTYENAKGIPYAANHGSSYGDSILWDHADITPALSATIWCQFAKMNFNPLLLGKQKNIPITDKFWVTSVY